jgi:iron-sulfur cluster assembly protein
MKQIVTVTDSARDYIINVLKKTNTSNLVVGLKGGGCAGFEYFWAPVTKEEYTARGDTTLDEVVLLDEDFKLIIDNPSIIYLLGSTIDYKSDFVSSQLVVENPNAKSNCGCNKSVAF